MTIAKGRLSTAYSGNMMVRLNGGTLHSAYNEMDADDVEACTLDRDAGARTERGSPARCLTDSRNGLAG